MTMRVLVGKEMRVEWRGRDTLAGVLTVALLIALAGYVAFIARVEPEHAVPGVLWTGIVFAAQIGLARSFVVEKERGTLEGVLASPANVFHLWLGKLIVNATATLLVGIVLLVALWLFFDPGVAFAPLHLLVLVLGVVGVAAVATLNAAIAMHGRNWVLLVPLLSLPALYPVLATTIPATFLLMEGVGFASIEPSLRVLVAYDAILLIIAWLLVPFLLEP